MCGRVKTCWKIFRGVATGESVSISRLPTPLLLTYDFLLRTAGLLFTKSSIRRLIRSRNFRLNTLLSG